VNCTAFSVRRSYFESLSTNGFCLDRSLSFVEGRPLGERTGEGELRVVIDRSIPPSSAERVSTGLNFEVEMRNVEPSEPLN
jgi:hypothetical protein